jgi:hypothetical protein
MREIKLLLRLILPCLFSELFPFFLQFFLAGLDCFEILIEEPIFAFFLHFFFETIDPEALDSEFDEALVDELDEVPDEELLDKFELCVDVLIRCCLF